MSKRTVRSPGAPRCRRRGTRRPAGEATVLGLWRPEWGGTDRSRRSGASRWLGPGPEEGGGRGGARGSVGWRWGSRRRRHGAAMADGGRGVGHRLGLGFPGEGARERGKGVAGASYPSLGGARARGTAEGATATDRSWRQCHHCGARKKEGEERLAGGPTRQGFKLLLGFSVFPFFK